MHISLLLSFEYGIVCTQIKNTPQYFLNLSMSIKINVILYCPLITLFTPNCPLKKAFSLNCSSKASFSLFSIDDRCFSKVSLEHWLFYMYVDNQPLGATVICCPFLNDSSSSPSPSKSYSATALKWSSFPFCHSWPSKNTENYHVGVYIYHNVSNISYSCQTSCLKCIKQHSYIKPHFYLPVTLNT